MFASNVISIDQRFAQLIKQFGLTKNSFAISLGKTASVVQHLIDGRNKPGYDLLCKVFEIYPNVSRDWLLLGRGPMLVSGEHAPKLVAPAVATTPELPLEPIDLSDVEVPTQRRSVPGVAGTRLQPADIAATLALAAAATQPVRATAPVLDESTITTGGAEMPTAHETPTAAEAASIPEAPIARPQPLPLQPLGEASPSEAQPAPAAPPALAPAAPVAPASTASSAPEAFIAAALHAQHLQHQLSLSEMRNQHLLEQQQMLREMLAMARQAMV